MKEEIVSFETAKLAKEKGFNEITKHAYWKNIENNYFLADNSDMENSELCDCNYSAPTQSLLQKWLREVHNAHIWSVPLSLNHYEYYYFKDGGYTFSSDGYPTYEMAIEEALKKCLLLI